MTIKIIILILTLYIYFEIQFRSWQLLCAVVFIVN